eukprot:6247974-Amphidinium_carterae.1
MGGNEHYPWEVGGWGVPVYPIMDTMNSHPVPYRFLTANNEHAMNDEHSPWEVGGRGGSKSLPDCGLNGLCEQLPCFTALCGDQQ